MNITSNKSIGSRLLTFVNLMTLITIAGICGLMVYTVRNLATSALQTKVESNLTYLMELGPSYINSHDTAALEKLAKIVSSDPDLVYAVFYDNDDKALTDTKNFVNNGPNIVKTERELFDVNQKRVGKIAAAYRTDSIQKSYHQAVLFAVIATVFVNLILTLGVWALVRSILDPVIQSLKKLTKMSQVLGTTSNDITASSESLSSGVNQQASVVQQTTSAMTEMSGMLAQSATYSKQSEQVMESMTHKAKQGMNIMNDMVEAMTSVQQANGQLKQMAKIISEITSKTNVINDIVFKTQLLSFNASIEAARAGQHGRGFSVVAEEVGNLAKMSGTAAQEIAALLQDSERQVHEIVQTTSERVNAGKNVAEQAMKNFKEIASEISQTSIQISNISAATKEQEYGIAQTTEAMSELNKTAEANSVIAQKSNQAANTLRHETKVLSSITKSIHDVLLGKNATAPKPEKFASVTRGDTEPMSLKSRSESRKEREPSAEIIPLDATADFLSDKVVEMAKKRQLGADTGAQSKPGANESSEQLASDDTDGGAKSA